MTDLYHYQNGHLINQCERIFIIRLRRLFHIKLWGRGTAKIFYPLSTLFRICGYAGIPWKRLLGTFDLNTFFNVTLIYIPDISLNNCPIFKIKNVPYSRGRVLSTCSKKCLNMYMLKIIHIYILSCNYPPWGVINREALSIYYSNNMSN